MASVAEQLSGKTGISKTMAQGLMQDHAKEVAAGLAAHVDEKKERWMFFKSGNPQVVNGEIKPEIFKDETDYSVFQGHLKLFSGLSNHERRKINLGFAGSP